MVEVAEEEANDTVPGGKWYYFRNIIFLGQMGGKEGWHMLQPPRNGEGTVRAETVYGPCVPEERPSGKKQFPGRGRRKRKASEVHPIRDGSGERCLPLGTACPVR